MDFNPKNTILNYTVPEFGVQSITFAQLDQHARLMANYSIVHGCSIIACAFVLVLLFLVIKSRKTPIFMLNQVILITSIIRSGLFLGYQLGPLGSLTTNFTGMVTYDNRNLYKLSIAGNAVMIVFIFLIQLSFTYQTWIIFQSPEVKIYGYLTTFVATLLMGTTFALYVTRAVFNTRFYESSTAEIPAWILGIPQIIFSVSVNYMSVILVLKLIFAIKTRRYLGLKQFSYYHILVIMFTQTMLIPTALTFSAYSSWSSAYGDLLNHLSLALIAILLPFTSIWSILANNSRNLSSNGLIYLTSSGTSTDSTMTSPIDEKTLADSYSFFPEKLLKLRTNESSNSGQTKASQTDSFMDTLPNEILDILKDEENGLQSTVCKHLSSVSRDTIDKLDSAVLVEQVFNHK